MAKRKTKLSQNRKRSPKKKSILPKLIIGGVVIGGGYLLYKNVIAPMLKPAEEPAAEPTAAGTSAAINTAVSAANSTTANVPSTSAANKFSAMGTTWSNLKKDIPITYGSKGQEILTMQKLINKILRNQGWTTRIAEDGDFGPSTWNVHKNLSFQARDLNWWWNASEKGIPGVAPKGVSSASAPSGSAASSSVPFGFTAGGPAGALIGYGYDYFFGD